MANCWVIFGIMGNRWPIVRVMGNCWPICRNMGDCWPIIVSSETTNPDMDVIASIREMYEKIDPLEQIEALISFVENHLQKMNILSEAGSSSSEGWIETVGNSTNLIGDSTKLAAKIIDTISAEAEKISNSVDAVGNVTLTVIEGVGESSWVFIGLSVAAYAVENYSSVGPREMKCREILLNILKLADEVIRISDVNDMLGSAVGAILEGTIIFCEYMDLNRARFLSATTAACQLEKTNKHLRDLMDSHALPSLQQHWDKDVFLSHSGKQKNFVRQLRQDLIREHVSCFFDEDRNSLPFAEKFPSLMLKAAETCKIAVVVLSKDFILSKWPMIELSAFFRAMQSRNSKLKIIPIFFEISPRDLSRIEKDNPDWQKLKVSNYTRCQWEATLKKVRPINGMDFSKGGDEVDCRKQVVQEICRLLRGIKRPKLLEIEPVGIEKQVREVKALLDMEGAQSALAVIVCGLGGMGKSTVAASVVESLDWYSADFKFCRVAIDRKTHDIKVLQKIILSHLGGVNVDLEDTLDGRLKIKEALKNKRCLLFVDNVVDKGDIQDLLPQDLSDAGQNTKLRIIITSREKDVKAKLNVMCRVYEVKGLSTETYKSFLSKTIKQSQEVENLDPEEEERLINEVAFACRGVPLLLSVFGQHLRVERNKESYDEALEVLREGNLDSYRDEDLGTTLMHVYNKIKDAEVKEIFLDICTYFHGWEWNLVADIVEIHKLKDLHRRMLVSKSDSGEVIVHDILLLMGMNEAEHTRFSNGEKLSDALEGNLNGSVIVKGISLVKDSRSTTIQSTQLEATHQCLRVLMLGDWVTLDGLPCEKAFKNLRCLCVGDITAFPFKDPSKLDKLRVFMNRSKPGMNLPHLPSSLKRISHEVLDEECDKFVKLPFQNLKSLKSFIVKTQKSVELPEELHLPVSLVDLDLSTCKNLPKAIGHLTALESLILNRSDLELLPQRFGSLKKLKHLSMDYCTKLRFLSEELGMLSSLEVLSMKGCGNLRALPESLGGLLSLQTFELSECIKLQELPESFGELRIQSLNLHSLVDLNKLPNSFGNMIFLKYLSLESCLSLMSLPNSFVQLTLLETLNIIRCTKLSLLPKDFGCLRCLKRMTVEDCHFLKELPHGFGALPALKTFRLVGCNSFVNLPRDFIELTSLEELDLEYLPWMSRIPDGLEKLKKLRILCVQGFIESKTWSDDFAKMATLEQLSIMDCSELEGAMMEKILKLPNCYSADISGSTKLLEKWEHIQGETEHPIVVVSRTDEGDKEEARRAIKVALLHGKCMELKNGTDQLMERSSLFVGLEEGSTATVALIMLPIDMQSHQQETIQRYVKMVRETANTAGSDKLEIVCARKIDLHAERPTVTEEEERAEEERMRQILKLLPRGSCAIPSSQWKRVKVLTWCCDPYRTDKIRFVMANVGCDIEGRKIFKTLKFSEEDEISGGVPLRTEMWNSENKHYNSIQKFIKSICPPEYARREDDESQSERVAGENMTREFIEALKGNGIHYLLIQNNSIKVMVDELHGKAIGFIICDLKVLECIKLQQIYKDLQQKDSDFMWIWIPTEWPPEDRGHGTYTRLIQHMPWAIFPDPQLVNVERTYPCFVLLDKHGQIANRNAMPLLLAWGLTSYPFTQHTIPESFSLEESQSCLEFLLHGMNIVGRKKMKNKMTFLYAEHRSEWLQNKCKLEELIQIHGSFEVLYLGIFCERYMFGIENIRQEYEHATHNMRWPSLSFSDMVMFWYRCKYLANEEGYQSYKESSIMMETLRGLARHLYGRLLSPDMGQLVLVDNHGPVTYRGEDVVQMICEPYDKIRDGEGMGMVKDELMKSLSRGECTPLVRSFFRDEIRNLPQHPQHRIEHSTVPAGLSFDLTCHVCGTGFIVGSDDRSGRSYNCTECMWVMCGTCWNVICQTALFN